MHRQHDREDRREDDGLGHLAQSDEDGRPARALDEEIPVRVKDGGENDEPIGGIHGHEPTEVEVGMARTVFATARVSPHTGRRTMTTRLLRAAASIATLAAAAACGPFHRGPSGEATAVF